MKKTIKDNVLMIKSIINEVLDSEDERNDDENFFAVLDRLEIIQKLLNPNQK
jgi:hypothetical protein